MASPAGPSRRELQLLADSHEQWQIKRYLTERKRPLRAQLAEIVIDGVRAGEIRARLEASLQVMPPTHRAGA